MSRVEGAAPTSTALTSTLARVRAALEPRFALAAGAVRGDEGTWLDTADWLLHRKGLACEFLDAGPGGTLVLHGGHGERWVCLLPAGSHPPLRLEQLPEGRLRGRLGPVLGLRALLPLVAYRRSVREVRVLDGADKTVVRLVIGGAASVSGVRDGVVAARLCLVGVRGYAASARVVARALQRQGLAPMGLDRSEAVLALEAGGYRPGVLPGVLDPRPEPTMPAAVAVAAVLRSFLDQLEANVPGTVGDVDVEFLHDLRIAVRRSRSALKLAGDVLPPGAVARFAPELKWLGDVTTPVRDLDVHLLGLPDLAARLSAFAPQDLDPFAVHLARHRVGEQRALARSLSSRRYQRFLASWRALLEGVIAGPGHPPDGVGAGVLAAARVARADRRVVRLGSRITAQSPAEDLHTLRKRAKELRYVLDLFSAVLDATHVRALIGELKALQDVLGAFQDSEVQREALARFAAQMVAEQNARRAVPVETLLALGELATHLEDDQHRARAVFEERFRRFVRPAVRRHVAALTAGQQGSR